MTRVPRAVDLFCGAGGLSHGLRAAGFDIRYAVDNDSVSCRTYRENLGSHVECRSVAGVTAQEVLMRSRCRPGDIDLVAGGPPCQGFSVQGRGADDDPRNDLVLAFASLAISLSPTFILIENVPTILGVRGKNHIGAVEASLAAAGYRLAVSVVDAAGFGVPQHRRRAILVAWSERVADFAIPKGSAAGAVRTVRNAISDLPEPPLDYTEHPGYHNHVRVRSTPLNELRISHVPPGGGRLDIPPHLQLPCHRNAGDHRHLDVYGRMEWDRPAPTITAMFDNFTRGRFAHPSENRTITSREAARLQSFPDDFRFCGTKKQVARQVGNAVPHLLARAVGEAIFAALSREEHRSRSTTIELAAM